MKIINNKKAVEGQLMLVVGVVIAVVGLIILLGVASKSKEKADLLDTDLVTNSIYKATECKTECESPWEEIMLSESYRCDAGQKYCGLRK